MGDYNDAFLRNNAAGGPANVQSRVKAQARTNVLQLKLIGQSHPTGLTNNLLKLFEPRPPLEFKPPPEKNKCPPYTGMAQYVPNFAEPSDAEYAPPVQKGETPTEKRARVHLLRLEEGAKRAAEELEKYDPSNDPNISGDPYKTLFVARLNYETTESRIKREFEAYGPIKRVRLVADKEKNKPRGYAFIEYMHTRDMKAAYKQADGRKLDNRRVLVDVERGRTVPNWRPRRLGGGLGTTRVGGEEVNQRHSGREQNQSGGSRRSEEPKVREDRERDREKSRERGKDREREREKSREHSHERPRDRDHREDRHHRDRERTRDRERERERDKGRDRTRDRDRKERSGRDRHRDEEKIRGRDLEVDDIGRDRGRSRDKDYDYDRVDSKHERDRHGDREKSYGHPEPEDDPGWYKQPEQEHRRSEAENEMAYDYYDDRNGLGKYGNPSNEDIHDRYQHSDRDHDRYDQMDEDREYHRLDRSLSREYK
ncbi:U1 small nuclear ribonucleoprotein 70 kDa isoform X1 [Daucus carota subsp. sativus]|uniref:U1 small nuclear ribonucleoprotein 70 kDa isoform X1 n=1 Tax=Daucus carota subsp. sativus TaxID=79200 RepID=UPI0007B24484|nr:PREDICTED: U1 small nuclear ribonucleoprotein 70 kDa-like isoform X1 [Daucus carota subsp. sativus]